MMAKVSSSCRLLVVRTDCLNAYVKRYFPMAGRQFAGDYVAMHAWHKGAVEITTEEATALLAMKRDTTLRADDVKQPVKLPAAFYDDGPIELQGIVDRTAVNFPAIQNFHELHRFLERLAARPPRLVVEIGTASGGLFFALCQLCRADGEIISIDLKKTSGAQELDVEREVFKSFAWASQKCHFIAGSSLAWSSVRALERILDGRKIDLLFIDGSHDYGAVKSDFELYAPFCAADGVVAFHDINVFPDSHGPGMDVGVFWSQLKRLYTVEEIIDEEGATSSAEWRQRLQELRREQPRLFDPAQRLETRELLALDLGSEFSTSPKEPAARATNYRSVLDIPSRYQMAWGIGLLHGPSSR